MHPPTRPINRELARRHLEFLDRTATEFIFAAFPESPGATGKARHWCDRLDRVLAELELAQRWGYGIFVTVNAMTGSRRRIAELAHIRAAWCERDQPGPALPLTASLRIRTSPGKGHEWLLMDSSDSLPPAEAERINRQIVTDYGGDPNARDLARVLRLAGTWHLKGEPHQVAIIGGTGKRYSRAELLTAFPAPKPSISQRASVAVVRPDHPHRDGDRYVEATAARLLAELAHAQPGARNATLNWCGYRLATLGLDGNRVADLLTPVAVGLGLRPAEVAATIASAIRGAVGKSGRAA